MIPRYLDNDFYLIYGIDRRLEKFENMFTLPHGVSYNSYFLDDEKTIVFDSIDNAVSEEFMEALFELLAGRSLDGLVVNHVEPDHGATVCQVMAAFPGCRLYISKLGYTFLQQFNEHTASFSDRVVFVDEGFVLETGRHSIEFIKAPNVHWPEVTVCFDRSSGTLLSADAFGSFAAPSGYLYADQVDYEKDWLAEARRYYTNIVGRHGTPTLKLLEKAAKLDIAQIYPLHGLLFRTKESIAYIVDKYIKWAGYEAEDVGTVIVYGSLYNNSQRMADTLAAYLAEEESGQIRVYDASKTNVSEIIADLFRFSHAVFICNNYNTELYPPMDALLRELMMLNWNNHSYALLGNKSWGGRALKIAEEILSKANNLTKLGQDFMITSSMKKADRSSLQALAKELALSMEGIGHTGKL